MAIHPRRLPPPSHAVAISSTALINRYVASRLDRHFLCTLALNPFFIGVCLLSSLIFTKAFALTVDQYQDALEITLQQCTATRDQQVAQGLSIISHCTPCTETQKAADRKEVWKLADERKLSCELQAVSGTLSSVKRAKADRLDKLRLVQSSFDQQVKDYESWNASITKDYDSAIALLSETVLGTIVDGIRTTGKNRSLDAPLQNLGTKAKTYQDIRRAKQQDIKTLITSLEKELQGKNRDEAKRIVLRRIRDARTGVNDVHTIGTFLTNPQVVLQVTNDDVQSNDIDQVLNTSYSAMMMTTDLMSNHIKKSMKILAGWSGALALAPTLLDTAITLGTAAVDESNIQALNSLRESNTQQLQILRHELSSLLSLEKTLKTRKVVLEGRGGPQ